MKTKLMIALVALFMGIQLNANSQNNAKPAPKKEVKADKKAPCPGQACQAKKMDPAKMMDMKVKQMSHSLMLSDENAKKFESLYKSYLNEIHEAYKSAQPEAKKAAKDSIGKEFTDADIDNHFKAMFKSRAKVISIQESYYAKFRKFLSAKQVSRIFAPQKNEKGPRHMCKGPHGKKDMKRMAKHQPQQPQQRGPHMGQRDFHQNPGKAPQKK